MGSQKAGARWALVGLAVLGAAGGGAWWALRRGEGGGTGAPAGAPAGAAAEPLPAVGEGTVRGRALDAQGAPAPGAVVGLKPAAELEAARALALSRTLVTGADGTFSAGPLPLGEYGVAVSFGGRGQATALATLATAGAVAEVEVRLGAHAPPGPRATLRGRVLDGAGQPLGGAVVVAAEGPRREAPSPFALPSAGTLPDGTYALELPADASRVLWVQHPDFPPQPGPTARAGGAPVDVQLTPGARVAGEVRGADGRPVTDFTLLTERAPAAGAQGAKGAQGAEGAEAGPELLAAEQVRAPDGRFALGPLLPGRYVLRVRTPDGRQGSVPVGLTAGGPTSQVRLTLGAP
jgi:hypothetical protein